MNQVQSGGISVDQLQQLFKNAVRPQETNHVIPEFVEYNPHEASERLKSILDGSVEFLKENKQVKTAERTHNFIITSHTTGQNQAIREKLLRDLVTSLKHYFQGCYVVVGSASDVPQDIIDIADCVFFDKIQRVTPPAYHGNGELQLVKEGLRVMHEKGKEWCVKFTYDFIINDSNFNMINEWAKIADTQNKEFVGTTWVDIKGSQWDVALQQNTVGTWLYYGKVSFLKDVFDTMQLDDIIERKVTQAFMGKSDKAFLYPSANDMLGGTWEECGDLITNAGNNIKPSFEKKQAVTPRGVNDKPRVLCYVCTKDRFFTTLPMTLTSLVLQTRVPDHLIIFEDGEHKDLNEVPYYKAMFETLGRKGCTVWMQYEQGKGQNVLDQKANMQKGYDLVWRCFLPKEQVETIGGARNIETINVGDIVKTHKNRYRPVTKVYKNYYQQHRDVVWVKTKYSTIRCTPEHPFLVFKNGQSSWVKASHLKTGFQLAYPTQQKKDILSIGLKSRGPKGKKYETRTIDKMDVDVDLARFLGLYLAEGCGGHDSIRFTFSNEETHLHDFIVKICQEKFGRTPGIHKRWATTVKLNIRDASRIFTGWFGCDARHKKIPEFVFGWSLKNRLSFLDGYFEGDGWWNSGRQLFGTASKQLAEDLSRLFISCGLGHSEISFRVPKKPANLSSGQLIHGSGVYEIALHTKSVQKYHDILEADVVNGEYLGITVEDVVKKKMYQSGNPEHQYVYNLEVKEDNSYIVGSVAVHNCDDDEVAEHDVLERMLKYFENNPKLGAVGGFVGGPLFGNGVATGKLENIFSEQNVQWHNGNAVYENVDHLHSSFLYRPGIVNFHQDLSPVSHRGETIFTASLKRAGYQLIVDQTIKIWHYRAAGGIRSHDNVFLYDHDEKKFMDKLEEWGYRICVLDNGIGDHAIFLGSILPELQKKYPHLILSVCYPEIFSGKLRPGDSLISIGQAPNPARLRDDVYTGLAEGRLKGSLQDAFRQLYLENGKEK